MNTLEILSDIYVANTDEELLAAIDRLSTRQKNLLIMAIFKTLKAGESVIDLKDIAESIHTEH